MKEEKTEDKVRRLLPTFQASELGQMLNTLRFEYTRLLKEAEETVIRHERFGRKDEAEKASSRCIYHKKKLELIDALKDYVIEYEANQLADFMVARRREGERKTSTRKK